MAAASSPPHELDLVIDFVNTRDVDAGTDELSGPGDLGRWLADRHVLGGDASPRRRDLDEALRLREALRRLMLANNDVGAEDGAAQELERAARRGALGVHFAAGTVSLAPDAGGVAGALARLLVPVARAIEDGSWLRVKACPAPDCQWAFYDRSRNRSGVWCDMAVCGNRTKVRAYRERTPRGER